MGFWTRLKTELLTVVVAVSDSRRNRRTGTAQGNERRAMILWGSRGWTQMLRERNAEMKTRLTEVQLLLCERQERTR